VRESKFFEIAAAKEDSLSLPAVTAAGTSAIACMKFYTEDPESSFPNCFEPFMYNFQVKDKHTSASHNLKHYCNPEPSAPSHVIFNPQVH
jgi:hypothetical protein